MKIHIYYSMSALLWLFSCLTVSGQTSSSSLAGESIRIEDKNVEKTDNNLLVRFNLNMDSLRMKSDHRLVFTPMLQSGENVRELPKIIVNGRKQAISFDRFAHKDFPDNAVVVRRKNKTEQSVSYSAVLPYEQWMKNSNVVVAEDLCGCGDIENQTQTIIHKLRAPYMAYIRPEAEARKERSEQGRAFIDFPVNKIELYPEYRNNPSELQKIVNTINLVKEDKNTTITNIEIHGYASPESPYDHNAYLAENRAKTLKDYVRNLMNLDDGLFSIASTPEDWEGLRDYLDKNNIENKEEILAIVNDETLDPDTREWRIKLNYPEPYRYMLNNWYPALRHSDYVVTYNVRPFSVEEAKSVLRTNPKQLSLEEMFLVAQTYEPGSAEFNDVFRTAVALYPDDPTANLNAACAEIETGDYASAEKYLAKAGNTPYVAHARGVIALKKGDEAEARRQFGIAARGGVKQAEDNLKLLDM